METARVLQVQLDTEVTLHANLELDAGKPQVVLSNSIGADHRMWDAQMPQLRAHASVLRYDQRGHGRSSAPRGPYAIADLGTDVIRLMDHLHIEKAIFCGLSLGGLTGMWLGIHHPERLLGLMLVNTAPSFPRDVWLERSAQARAQGMQPLVEATLVRWFTPGFAAAHPEHIDAVRQMILRTSPEGYASCGDALGAADLAGELDAIRCPVRVVAGRSDPATPPARSEEIVRAIPGSELVTLQAAHVAPIEAAQPFAVLLRDFVARHGYSGAPVPARPDS